MISSKSANLMIALAGISAIMANQNAPSRKEAGIPDPEPWKPAPPRSKPKPDPITRKQMFVQPLKLSKRAKARMKK